jgi:two-component system, chemotaxis family, protein-glutamate methylesterase/glutaminase
MTYAIIVIGTSRGGLRVMQQILGALPPQFPLPIVLVQHREPGSDDTLLGLLQTASALPVVEILDKQIIRPGHVYLAPADYHTLVEDDHFALSADEPVNYSRPSIDVLFESASDAYGERVVGVVLTGANNDGARGLALIKARGGLAVVQDPETSEAPAMPKAALKAVAGAQAMPVEEIGQFLVKTCQAGNPTRE